MPRICSNSLERPNAITVTAQILGELGVIIRVKAWSTLDPTIWDWY